MPSLTPRVPSIGFEQADRDREPVHRLEDPDEVGLLLRTQLLERGVLVGFGVGEDHALHDRQPVAEEHVLGATEADALGAELAGALRVFGQIRVRAHAQASVAVGPAENRAEVTGRLGCDDRDLAERDLAGGTGDRDHVALVHRLAAGDELLGTEIDPHLFGAADRGLAHAARDDRGVRNETAA